MKKTFIFLFLSQCCFCYSVLAQQNLFNVPSSEITAKKGIFFQQQFNINDIIQSNTTLCYGLGKNFEVGLNLIGAEFKPIDEILTARDSLEIDPLAPLAMLNFQKSFKVSKHFNIALGTQVGTNIRASIHNKHVPTTFSYINTLSSFFDEKVKVNTGLYYGHKSYVGYQSKVGFMIGCEAAITEKFHLVGDWIEGKHAIGEAVLGFIYYVTPHIPLSFGWQIPNSNRVAQAFVFEFTYVPFERKK